MSTPSGNTEKENFQEYKYKNPREVLLTTYGIEWRLACGIAAEMVKQKKIEKKLKPFRIPRDLLRKKVSEKASKYINHDFLVHPKQDGSFEIGAMPSLEAYIGGVEKVEGVLGRGSFGVVFTVQWQNGGTSVVKVAMLTTEYLEERKKMEGIKAFGGKELLEAAFREELSPEVIGYKWLGKSIPIRADRVSIGFIIQKKIPGINLADYFKKHSIKSLDQKIELALKSAMEIGSLHRHNILHCDIKPDNFLVNWDGKYASVVPVDYGMAMKLEPNEKERHLPEGSFRGSIRYVAPEICKFKRDKNGDIVSPTEQEGKPLNIYSKKSDVYSLGIMFRDDLKLGGTMLSSLVTRMIDHNPRNRPTMGEVVATIKMLKQLDYEDEDDYSKVYSVLEKYAKPPVLGPFGESTVYVTTSEERTKIIELLTEYMEFADTSKERRIAVEDGILSCMKEHEDRVKETGGRRIGDNFNLEILQSLPQELRTDICEKLHISAENLNSSKLSESIASFKPSIPSLSRRI